MCQIMYIGMVGQGSGTGALARSRSRCDCIGAQQTGLTKDEFKALLVTAGK